MRSLNWIIFLTALISVQSKAQETRLRNNDRISGTSHLTLTEGNLLKLFDRTKDLADANRHFTKTTVNIGQSSQFFVYNFSTEKYENITATLESTVGNISIWVADDELDNQHVNAIAIQNITDNLLFKTPLGSITPDNGILNIIHNYFGLPPDMDGDNTTDFLITDIKDDWTEGNGFIAGYFNPVDQYQNGSVIGTTPISGSNERDILYIDSYPGIFHNNSYRYDTILATLSHEYQHLVHYNYDRNESTFVNEGLSELSSYLCGYGLRNPSLYLLNSDLGLTQWDSDINEALKHYAKVALWTYYLYEKHGSVLIKNITQSNQNGIDGIQQALGQSGTSAHVNDIISDFFITITLNDVQILPEYSFDFAPLYNLRAAPIQNIYDYPNQITKTQYPYSLCLFNIENSDSLQITFQYQSQNSVLYLNKFYAESRSPLNLVSDAEITDYGYKNIQLMSINSSNLQEYISADIEAKQKYYIDTYDFDYPDPDLNINTDEYIIANQFLVSEDSCILNSMRFYNPSGNDKITLYIYEGSIDVDVAPKAKEVSCSDLLSGDWIDIDLSDYDVLRNKGESFDIGLGFLSKSSAGYAAVSNLSINSFMKKNSENRFSELSNFEVDSESLSGLWMMNITYAKSLDYKPEIEDDMPDNFTLNQLGPSPFPTPGNPNLTILYTISNPGNVRIRIYDILGQVVSEIFNGYETGPNGIKQWNGRNISGSLAASGSYFLHFEYDGQSEFRKILIIR